MEILAAHLLDPLAVMGLGYTHPAGGDHEKAVGSTARRSVCRARAGLSRKARAHHRAVPARRHHRPDRAHHATEIPGVPRPDAADREPLRRRRLGWRRRSRQGSPRRPHAADGVRHPRGEPPRLQDGARPVQGARAHLPDGEIAERAGGGDELRAEQPAGSRRLREGESRKGDLFHPGARAAPTISRRCCSSNRRESR